MMPDANVFAKYKTEEKWDSIATGMRNLQQSETAFSMRRRLNPHHSDKDVKDETSRFRASQYVEWCKIKDLYAEHRDELACTFENNSYISCRNVLELIFTNELDDALRQTLEE